MLCGVTLDLQRQVSSYRTPGPRSCRRSRQRPKIRTHVRHVPSFWPRRKRGRWECRCPSGGKCPSKRSLGCLLSVQFLGTGFSMNNHLERSKVNPPGKGGRGVGNIFHGRHTTLRKCFCLWVPTRIVFHWRPEIVTLYLPRLGTLRADDRVCVFALGRVEDGNSAPRMSSGLCLLFRQCTC